ncbi:MAG: hypothetical protein JWN40_457 [Phycisphaerales bacterium]|nr:hypothetical protein [Phycisphaerales bacterium]
MAWERIRHWHWLVIAVIIGLAVPAVRARYVDDAIRDLGESLNGQAQFEESLLRPIQGRRQFDNVTVTPERIDDGLGGKRFVHVVRGQYWDGRLDPATGQATWRPAFFVAPVPYHMQLDPARLGPQAAQVATQLAAIKNPTVLDFLAAVHQTHNVTYTYAWWRGSAYALWLWLSAAILLIGIALPLTINLTVYSTFRRPRIIKEDGIDLSKVAPTPTSVHTSAVTDQDHSRLAELERELEQKLSATSPTPSSAPLATSAPIPKLSAAPLAPAGNAQLDHKEFGAKEDDFYPTERHH